jgi:hypothetical protein
MFLERFGGAVVLDHDGYHWRLYGRHNVQCALAVLHPYIWNKSEQADVLLQHDGPITEAIADRLKELKALPPLLPEAVATAADNAKVVGGFIGSDGAVYLSLPKAAPTVDFRQKHRAILDEICRLFPGPRVLGPYTQKRKGVEHTSYRLRYRGAAAAKLLGVVGLHISCAYKKEIARLILEAKGKYREPALAKKFFGLALNGKNAK